MSLCVALEMLGFGPCYHPMKNSEESRDWFEWASIAEGSQLYPPVDLSYRPYFVGDSTPERFDKILSGYHSVVDSPVAIMAAEVYAAYPDAKYILVGFLRIDCSQC